MNTQDIPQSTPPLPRLRKTVLLPANNKSEVARLMQQIDTEYNAAVQGLTGFSNGSARHTFINARMENMAMYFEELEKKFGPEAVEKALIEWNEELASSTAKEGPLNNNEKRNRE
jgi:hypothetical protein